MQALVAAGAGVDKANSSGTVLMLAARNSSGDTVLMLATRNGREAVVRALLAGADADKATATGRTAQAWAAAGAH